MTTLPLTAEARACGALLGLAAGDALGVPLVGMGREQAQIKHATVSTYLGGGLYLLGPGETTGRVAMVRAAALALLDDPPLEEHALARYLSVLDVAPPGLGEATRASLERMRDGEEPSAAARGAHEALDRRTAGIGPALRAVPYAIRWSEAPDLLIEHVLADAALTHVDLRAGAAAAALALWVREHLRGEDDPAAALKRVRECLAERPELPDVLPAPAAVERLPVRSTAFAPDVLHATMRHVLGTRNARRAVIGAVNEAGAAAALGAAAGAVVGARVGEGGLPESWTSLLRGAGTWRTLARRLHAAAN